MPLTDSFGGRGSYEARFRVTDLVSNRYGGRRELQEKLSRYLAPISPYTDDTNADILFDGVPQHVKVSGLAHDAVLQFYGKEPEFTSLGLAPGPGRLEESLRDLIEGKDSRSKYLRDRLSDLTRSHGITQENLYWQEVGGVSFGEFVEDFADYRAGSWEEDLEGVVRRNLEERTESKRLSGRADMLVETVDGDEVWEIKITGQEPPVDRHVYQADIYGWQLDAEPVIDYPLQRERFTPGRDSGEVTDMILEDLLDFDRTVRSVREMYSKELEERTGIKRDIETVEEHRERVHSALSPAASHAVAEEAAKEALKSV